MKLLNSKAIYFPKGKAGEYAEYACNFFVGCSCGCVYCYNKKGRFKAAMGGNTPTLKKCFKDEEHALRVFGEELKQNLPGLQKRGLFFSFATDPCLEETIALTADACGLCRVYGVPVTILTKRTSVDLIAKLAEFEQWDKGKLAFGFTLTGHDELEPNASTNKERIKAMERLHDAGFKTWASIEPIIDVEASLDMIEETVGFCDLWKIGLESGKKYKDYRLEWFMNWAVSFARKSGGKTYFKDSLLAQADIRREDLPKDVCVGRDYNIFKQ